MGSRSFAQVAPTSATIALNAYIFGYGGHSLVTPHSTLKQQWWTDGQIDAKVTREFVISRLRGIERNFLSRPFMSGENLRDVETLAEIDEVTDSTYIEWILDRAKRLFLILVEIGIPEQIFGCVDDSWADDDLPVPLDNVKDLDLACPNNETLNGKFYSMQFVYSLRELKRGKHTDYDQREHIPMEYATTLPPAVSLQIWDRVHFPGKSDVVYMRRKYNLADTEKSRDRRKTFMSDIELAQTLCHKHIAPIWASYTAGDSGYTLTDFVPEHTLRTYIDHRLPHQLRRTPLKERPAILCKWLHCLADGLSFLHHSRLAHTAIRPSSIWIDKSNHIAFADIGSMRTFQRDQKVVRAEAYDYISPEFVQQTLTYCVEPRSPGRSTPNKLKKNIPPRSSSLHAYTKIKFTSDPIYTTGEIPSIPYTHARVHSTPELPAVVPPMPKSPTGVRNFSRLMPSSIQFNEKASSSFPIDLIIPDSRPPEPTPAPKLNLTSSQKSDIYSLGCIYLDILTFILKGNVSTFVKFRTTKPSPPVWSTSSQKTRHDSSFHHSAEKLDAWITSLQVDCHRRTEAVFRGVPDLLDLVRGMLSTDPERRPTAKEVQQRAGYILVEMCGVRDLCCGSGGYSKGLKEAKSEEGIIEGKMDFLSIATGMVDPLVQAGGTSEAERGGALGTETTSASSRAEWGAKGNVGREADHWPRAFKRCYAHNAGEHARGQVLLK